VYNIYAGTDPPAQNKIMAEETQLLIYRPNRRRAQLAALLLGTSGLVCLLIIVALLLQVALLKRIESGAAVTLSEALTNDNRLTFLNAADILLYFVTGVFFMLWLYRACQNNEELAARPARYSPGWAVGGFIVPILNFFRPYQVVAEVWGTAMQSDSTDTPAFTPPSKTIVLTWWLTFIVPALITRLANSMATINESDYLTPTVMLITANGLLIVSAGLAIRIIQAIEQAHEQMVRRECPLDNWPPVAGWNPIVYLGSIGLAAVIGWLVIIQSVPGDEAAGLLADGSGPAPTPSGASRAAASANTQTPTRIPDPRTPILWATEAAKPVTKVPTRIPTKTPVSPVKLNTVAQEALEYYEKGEYRFALVKFNEALQSDPDNASCYLHRGRTHKQLGNSADALKDFDRALEIDPALAEAYFERGWIYYWDDNYGKARNDFEQALKLDNEYADAYVGRGFTYYALDDYALALTDLTKAVKLDTAYPEAYYGRGLVHYATGEYLKAAQDFSKTVQLDEEWPPAYYRRGLAHYALENLAAAQADLDRAIELDPDYVDPYFDRGVLLYDLGRYRAALADFDNVIEAYPEEGLAYLWRGAVYAKLNETVKAITDLEQAVKWSTDADLRREAEEMLKELKGEKLPTS
jgi:tetratricopeptide (TPR) repeat protein